MGYNNTQHKFQGYYDTKWHNLSGYRTLTKVFGDSPYTAKIDECVIASANGGNVVINLPAGLRDETIIVKKSDGSANTVTITPNGAETINGAATKVLTAQHESYTLMFNGTTWHIISKI